MQIFPRNQSETACDSKELQAVSVSASSLGGGLGGARLYAVPATAGTLDATDGDMAVGAIGRGTRAAASTGV